MSLIAGEYDKTLALNAGIELTGYTAMQLSFIRPDGTTLDITMGLTVGTVDLDIDGTIYPANQHILYAVQDGDFPIAGIYKRQLQVDFGPGRRRKSITDSFEVLV